MVPLEAHVSIPGISFPSYPSIAFPSSSSASSSTSAFYLVTFALLSNDSSSLINYAANTRATIASGSMQLKLRSQARTSTHSDLLAVVVCSSLDPTSCHEHFAAVPNTPDQSAVCTQAQAIQAEGGALWASYSIDTTDDGRVLFSGYLVWLSFLLLVWTAIFLASTISAIAKTTFLCCSTRQSMIGWRGLWSRVIGWGCNTGAAGEEYEIERNVWMQYSLVVGASILRFAFLAFVLLLTISKQLSSFSCIELSPFYAPSASMYVEPPVHYLFVYGSYYSAFALIVCVRHQHFEATARSTRTMFPPRNLLLASRVLLFACTSIYTCALYTLYGLSILFVDIVPHAEQGVKYETMLRLTSRWGGQFAICVVVLLCECMWFLSAKRLPPPPPPYLDLARILQANTEQDDLSEGAIQHQESGVAALDPSPSARVTHSSSSTPSTPPPPPSSTTPSSNVVFSALGGPGEQLCPHFSDTHTHVCFVVLCALSIITSFPMVTTGSWIGGFLLFSIASRVAELCVCVSVCFSIRVRFSSVRARFLSKIRSMSASFRASRQGEGEGDEEEQERDHEEDYEEKKEDERDDYFTPTTTPPVGAGGGHSGTSAWYSSWLSGKGNNNNSLDDDTNATQHQQQHKRSFDRPISTSPHSNSPPQERSTFYANRLLVKTEYSRV